MSKSGFIYLMISISLVFYSCTPKPFAETNRKYRKQAKVYAGIIKNIPKDSLVTDSIRLVTNWVGTVNFGIRKPNYVVIHHTAQNSCEQTLKTFTTESAQVSAHYVICKEGNIQHMLNDYLRAWHAGVSKWGNETDMNSASIGIEIDNNGVEAFSAEQLNSLLNLLSFLKKNYKIPASNFIGHADIAPGRKVDPNINFPWKRLAENGFGLWYDDTTGIQVSKEFDPLLALRIIGYDISDQLAAIQAFRRHFLQTEQQGALTEPEKKVLYMLVKKFI